mmetsp:Transcript_10331/g.28124  ORF Transcript_10331/g.28124 Transcript_10331/m.28124 type:complete len:324 (+) Transcript_10331:78-1049(+)
MVAPPLIKNTMNTMGTFSTPSFLGVGDPYDKPNKAGSVDPRLKGVRNFVGGPVPKSELYKGYQRLYEGEKWTSDFERTRKFSLEQKKKQLTEQGFRYSNPNKKSSGLGNYYGAIGPKHVHEGEFEGARKGEPAPEILHEGRQMMTGPSKKGRFNTPGILFGAPQPRGQAHILGKEFEYQSDPYNLARKLEMDARAKSKALRQPQPFKPMSASLDYMDATKSGISSKVYEPVPMPEPKRMPGQIEGKPVGEKPWYPARPPRSGIHSAINKFPEHIPDSEQERWQRERDQRIQDSNVAAWKYQEFGKTAPTKSILFHHPGMSTLN